MQVESTSTSNFQKGSTKLFPTSVIETATVIKELQRMKDGDQSLQVEIEKENHFMGGQLLVKVSAFIKALTEETNPIITEGKAHLIPNDMFDDDKMPKAICSLQDMSFQRAYRDGSAVITSATAENKIKKEESSVDWQEHQNKQTTEKHNFIKAGWETKPCCCRKRRIYVQIVEIATLKRELDSVYEGKEDNLRKTERESGIKREKLLKTMKEFVTMIDNKDKHSERQEGVPMLPPEIEESAMKKLKLKEGELQQILVAIQDTSFQLMYGK